MKKYLLLFLSMIFLMSGIGAQVVDKTINMTEAGTLSGILTTDEKQNVTNLTLTGPIDARDFKCMRDEIIKLAVLDLKAATIGEYTGPDGTVPGSITYIANKIPDFAFCELNLTGKTTLTSITFPENLIETGYASFESCTGLAGQLQLTSKLEVIGDYAFGECNGYTGGLKLPASVTSIGIAAFRECAGFTGKLIIPSGIQAINDWTFFLCTGFSSVEIPRDVTSIGKQAFYYCTGLKEFNSYPELPPALGDNVFRGVDVTTCVLHVPKGTLSAYKSALQWKDFVNIIDDLPRKVVDVKTVNMTTPGTLSGILTNEEKQNVTNLTLTGPIDARDFKCMRDEIVKLEVLDLKAALIQEYTGVEGTVPELTTYKANQIPEYAFCSKALVGKQSLKTITFPDNLTETGDYSFYDCSRLVGRLELPSMLDVIGDHSFYNCIGISGELKIPTTVTLVRQYAFTGCTGLTGKLTIPSGIKVINDGTFSQCMGLTSVEISKELISINSLAFFACTGLKEFDSWPDKPPLLGSSVFSGVNLKNCVLHVPVGALSSYRNAPQWTSFTQIVDDLKPTSIDKNTVKNVQIGSMNNQIVVRSEQEIALIEIYDLQGRMMINMMLKGSRMVIPIDKSGNYIIRVHLQDSSVRTTKISVE